MTLNYQFSDAIFIEWLVQNLPQFLFPDLSLQQTRIDRPFCGIIATHQRKPVGLILASSEKSQTIYRIHSFFVHPKFRNKGIGTSLINHLETAIQQKGGRKIEGHFRDHWTSIKIIKRLIKKQNWSMPSSQLIILKGTVKNALSYFEKNLSNKNYSFFSFTQTKKSDLEDACQKYTTTKEFDAALNPLLAPETIHLSCSFLVKRGQESIGWIVSHQIKNDLNELTALYLDSRYRTYKLAYSMLKKVFAEQARLGIPNFIATSKLNGNPVARLIKRQLATANSYSTATVFYSHKDLNKN